MKEEKLEKILYEIFSFSVSASVVDFSHTAFI